jgi:prepilin-type processing-associated H-X9-DG protein
VFYNNGIFFINSRISVADVTDGTSNTFMLAETRYQILEKFDPTNYFVWAGTSRAGAAAGDCCTSAVTLSSAVDQINYSRMNDPNHTGIADPLIPIGRAFSSFHRGGVHVALADGSVQFLSQNMGINLYRAMARRADGLPLGGEL